MLFREASLTSLRRDSTRGTKRMDGRFATNSPSSRSAILDLCSTLPLPTDLHPDIYYSQYYRARLYCVSRKASNGQLTLPRLPRPRSFPPPSLPSPCRQPPLSYPYPYPLELASNFLKNPLPFGAGISRHDFSESFQLFPFSKYHLKIRPKRKGKKGKLSTRGVSRGKKFLDIRVPRTRKEGREEGRPRAK